MVNIWLELITIPPFPDLVNSQFVACPVQQKCAMDQFSYFIQSGLKTDGAPTICFQNQLWVVCTFVNEFTPIQSFVMLKPAVLRPYYESVRCLHVSQKCLAFWILSPRYEDLLNIRHLVPNSRRIKSLNPEFTPASFIPFTSSSLWSLPITYWVKWQHLL